LVNAANHFANAILADLLKFLQFAQQTWIGGIEKVAEEMDFVAIHFGGQFARRNKFDSRSLTCNCGPGATFDRIMIGQGNRFEAAAAGLPGQFFGRVGPVGEIRMEMEISEHKLLHDASRAEQLSFNLVQNAIDEFAAVLGGKFFGNVDRLIDAHDRGNIVAMEHFVNGQTQDIPVHGGDTVKFPVFRVLFDKFIGLIPMLQGAFDERLGKHADGSLIHARRGQFKRFTPVGRAFFLRDGCSALRLPKLIERLVQFQSWIQVVLKQELDGALARLTSFAHNEKSASKRVTRKENSRTGL